jgi:hypothetical protein
VVIRATDLRRIALALPGAVERTTWDVPTFRAKNKIFMILGADGRAATVKARKEHQLTIIASAPRTFSVARYVGRHGWVTVRLSSVSARAMRELVIDAWRLTAPARAVALYDRGQGSGGRDQRKRPKG